MKLTAPERRTLDPKSMGKYQDLEQTRVVDLYALDGPANQPVIDAEALTAMVEMIPTREELASSTGH